MKSVCPIWKCFTQDLVHVTYVLECAGGASITGYKVIITGGGKTYTKTTTARSHTFTGLKNATQYTVTVEAITKYGSSSRVTVRVGVA